jgi:transcriptional regulator with XRE-family HTH domain
MTMRIAVFFEPSADRAIPFAAGPERYQRLAEELGRYAGAQVQIIKDVLRKAPADAYVLFAGSGDLSRSLVDCGSVLAARLAPRIVLLDVSWQKALEQLEKHRLAGAVDSLRLSEWLARPSSCAGPFGLRYLAKPLGASCVPMPALHSAHYCLLHSEQHHGMPHLLADYLATYDRDQQPLSTLPSVSLARVRAMLADGPGGKPQTGAGPEERTIRAAQVESVSIKRAINSLRRAREAAHMTLSQVAERSGVDPEKLGLLEGSDYPRATLGALRAYLLALELSWGWTLSESASPSLRREQKREEKEETASKTDQPIVVSGIGPREAIADIPEPSPPTTEVPWVLVERGMTFLGNRRIHRQEPEEKLYEPSTRARNEESHAGV